ncbi:MAG: PfkB family carbohydrate kinase [Phycisphaerales bacterium]
MIKEASGRSFGREIVVVGVEGGGNGPNLADGLAGLGASVDLFGTLGNPIHSAFGDIVSRCRTVTSIGGGHGRTLALEFDDGKLMLNETSCLGTLDEGEMNGVIDAGVYSQACRSADVIALVNWSKYPRMTGCWRLVAERVLAGLTQRPWVLVDLADPAGRSAGDVEEVLGVVASMQRTCRVVLGANLHESGVIARALSAPSGLDNSAEAMQATAREIGGRLGIEMVVVHARERAAIAWREEGAYQAAWAPSDYTEKPVRTTGVGDRFNAGLMYALARGSSGGAALRAGCAAGSFFVRNGRAGSAAEIGVSLMRTE